MNAPPSSIVACVHRVRATTRLVQCLTNTVVQQTTANALLAAGASPAMCDTPVEAGEFARVASGVLINAGTPSAEQYEGMRDAIAAAMTAGTPWVVDPVAVGLLSTRTHFITEIIQRGPSAIRGNASEIAVLAGTGEGGRGVDATDLPQLDVARTLAERTGSVVAVSGAQDLVVSDDQVTYVGGGHPVMQNVIGTGCFLGALCAAYLGACRDHDPHCAVVAAHAHTAAAGNRAARSSTRPGSFAVAWLDALAEVTADEIAEVVYE